MSYNKTKNGESLEGSHGNSEDDFEDEITQAILDEEVEKALQDEPSDNQPIELHSTKIQELEQKSKEFENKYLRTYADFDNFRKRAAKEREEVAQATAERLLREMLEVKDHLELTLDHAKDSAEVRGLRQGVELTLKQLDGVLKKHQVTEVNPLGEPFNPMFHEAIQQEESAEYKPGDVVRVYQKGYLINGRLLRAARVAVASEKSAT